MTETASRPARVRSYTDTDPLALPRRTDEYDRSQLFAYLSNAERAAHDHDPERWWSSVLRRRRNRRVQQLARRQTA